MIEILGLIFKILGVAAGIFMLALAIAVFS